MCPRIFRQVQRLRADVSCNIAQRMQIFADPDLGRSRSDNRYSLGGNGCVSVTPSIRDQDRGGQNTQAAKHQQFFISHLRRSHARWLAGSQRISIGRQTEGARDHSHNRADRDS